MAYIGNSPYQGSITGGNIVDGSIESIDLATLTNIDINSGSIDGTIIGASSAAAGSFTTLNTTSSVGIGTSSPSYKLDLYDASGDASINIKSNGTFSNLLFTRNGSGGDVRVRSDVANNNLQIVTAGSERLRIDSSGNLLVGTTQTPATLITTSTTSHEGVGIADGYLSIARNLTGSAGSGGVAFLNRLATDGPIADFRKDGTTVGSIGTYLSNTYYMLNNTKGITTGSATSNVEPCNASGVPQAGGYMHLGSSSYPWNDLYLSGGVYLGGTGAANKLDDCESGTWTPASGSNSTVSTIHSAWYRKVGDLVTVNAYITSVTTTSEDFTIAGLPFTNSSTYGHANVHYATGGGIANDNGGNLYVQQNATYIQCNAGNAIIAGAIMLSATYKVS